MRTVVLLSFMCLCSVVLREAAPQTLTVSIDVDYTPPADSVLGQNEYRAASSIVLICIVEGQEGPVNYTWDSTLAVGESPNQRTRNALGSDDTGTHTCNVTEDAINFESASIEINVVGAGIYVEVGDGSVPLGALPNNGLMIALSIMATVRLQFVCRSTSNSSGVGQLIGPVTSPDQFFNISTLQAGTLEVVNDGAFPSLTSMDQGIYTCQIPDSVGTMVDINVGIYPNGFNTPPTVTITRSDSESAFSISCISIGSPATMVVWTKDGEELAVDGSTIESLQSISARALSRYQNVLNIYNLQPDELLGTYTCAITNALGSVGNTLVIRGIQITGHEEPLVAGASTNLTCTSDLDVDRIEWLDGEETVISSTNNTATLAINFNSVSTDQQGQQYTCRVTSPYGTQQRTVNLTVVGAIFGFQQSTYTINEDAGVLSLCITFNGEIPPPETVTITVATQGNSATGGTDFQSLSQNLVFNSMSSPSDCIATVNIPILQDFTVEGTELFFVFLSSSDESVELFSTTVIIQDDDVLTVSFTEPNYIVSEDAGSVMFCLTSTGDLAIEPSPPITVNVASQAVTAQAPMDYLEISADIIFEIESTGSPLCVNTTIVDDDVVEGQEMFQLVLNTSSDFIVFTEPRVANVTILDNDNLTIGFQSAVHVVQEDLESTALVLVEVSSGFLGPGVPAVASVTAEDGTAIRGQDYTFEPITIDFQSGNVLPVTVVIFADIISEGMENFTLLLSTVEDYVIVTSATATVAIFDNRVLAEVPLSTTVIVGSTAEFRCSSNTPVNSLQWRIDGLFVTNQEIIDRGFTAETEDTSGIISTTLFAVANVSNNGSSIECVVSEINMLQTLSDIASLTVQVVRVGYEVTTYTTSEEEGSLTACIQIQYNEFLNDEAVTVTISPFNGSAFADEDFELNFRTDLDILENTGSQICVNVTIIDDELVEGVEVFGLTLDSRDQAVTFTIQSGAFVEIQDNDFLTVSFEDETYAVDEDEESELFCFIITGDLAPEVNATVNVTAQPISAQAEVDYSPVPQSLSFTINCAPGGDALCVEVNITDDDLVEGPEMFRLILITDDFSIPDVDTTTVTINDNDVLTVGFEETNYTVNENSGSVTFCFTATGNLGPGIVTMVIVTSQEITAEEQFDYLPAQELSMFTIGSNLTGPPICVQFNIVDGNSVEPRETFRIVLNTDDDITVLDPATALVTIIDDDDLTVGFLSTTYAFDEDAGTSAQVAVAVNAGGLVAGITATVSVMAEDGTAMRDEDYSINQITEITFSAGTTVQSLLFFIIDDAISEGTETFTLLLNTTDEFVTLIPASATVSISDNSALIEVPLSTTVVAGSTAEFRCSSATSVLSLMWLIDGLNITDEQIIERGFTEVQNVDDTFTTTLFAQGFVSNNGSMIQCAVLNIDMLHTLSDIASLTVEAVRVGFEATSYNASEEEGSVTFCLLLENNQILGTDVATVMVLTTGSATGIDITRNSPGRICASLTISDDELVEDGEVITLELRTNHAAFLITTQFAVVMIESTDVVTIGFTESSYALSESDLQATVDIAVTQGVLQSGLSARVLVSTINGTAEAEMDYVPFSEIVNVPQNSIVRLTLNPIDDAIVEGNEVYQVTLASLSDFAVVDPSITTVTISDNDFLTLGLIEDSSVSIMVDENQETVDVCLGIVSGTIEDMTIVSLTVEFQGGTATLGEDFILPSEPLMFGSGPDQDVDCFTVVIIDDSNEEGAEDINFELSNSDGFLVTPLTIPIVILDDEAINCGELLCLNGATCDIDGESANCICAQGFTGDSCGIVIVPPPVLTISSIPPSPIAGDEYLLRCNVTVFEEVLAPIEIYWTDSNGTIVTNETENPDLELINGERNAAASLVFMELLTSQAGEYTCNARVSPLSSDTAIGLSEEFHLVVRIPLPSLSLFVDTDCIFAGATRFALSCTIELDDSVDIPITAQINWLPESIFSNSRITVESVSQLSDTSVFISRLVFDPLLFADAENYTCSGYFLPGDEDSSDESNYVDGSDVVQDTILLNVEAPPIQVEISPAEFIRIPNAPPYNQYTIACNASLPRDIRLQWSFTWTDETTGDQFIVNDSVSITSVVDRGSTAFSALQVTEERAGTFLPTCLAEVFSLEDEEAEIISSEVSSLTVSVTGPNLPIQPVPAVIGTSFELAIISWTSSEVAYTPEVFHIEYTEGGTGSGEVLAMTQISETVMGTQDFSATDEAYSLILDGLKSDTDYSFQVVATNTEGSTMSQLLTFRTREIDAYTLEENTYEVPIGSQLRIDVTFNTPFFFDETVQYMFIPLDHTPLQQPMFILNGVPTVAISYAQVSPSLTGEYTLCRFDLCGSKITITVTIPTLTISTNLLVTQRPNSGEVQCQPSDIRAPVQWLNTMGIIPSDITVIFSPQTLDHIATFDGDSPPDRTEVFVCDLINVDEPDQPIDPQIVTVRFIGNPVAILNDDRELNPGAVINSFELFTPSNQPVLNLRCLSIDGHGELQWRTREVEALPDVVDVETAGQINFLNVSYSDSITRRDSIISYHPFDEQGTGYYACRSEESSYQAEVYTSLDDPIWELVTPRVYDVPLGAEVSISARYADSSLGYINNGEGFSYELSFFASTSPKPDGAVLLSSVTDASSNILSYVFPAEFSLAGIFQLSATHISSGVPYSEEINVTVFEPNVVEFDPVLFVQYGQNATVRCIPDDLRAPVLWVYSGLEEFFFQSYPFLFVLSPPGLNHTAIFDATAVSLMFNEGSETGLAEVMRLSFRCGFRTDGLVITDGATGFGDDVPFNPAFSELYIQPERIRMQYAGRSTFLPLQILNNTVVNTFTRPLLKREVGGPGPSDSPNGGFFESFEADCNAVQGHELPIWTTDSTVTGNASGIVVNDGDQPYGSLIASEYTATLFFFIVIPSFNGSYRCLSRSTGLFSQFFLTTENPFIARVSPAVVVVDEGDRARLEFQIAVNSNGNTWDTDDILFFFSNNIEDDRNRNEVSFVVDSAMFPQNYARNFTSVSREDAGVYIAEIFDMSCESADCFVEERIILDVILYCPSNANNSILWPRTQQNTVATAPCSQAGSFFREGPLATRRCMENGEWEAVDFTSCTLVESSRPFLLLSLVIEADEVEGEFENFLVMEVSRLLNESNVPYTDVTLQSAFIASVALTFQVVLDPSVSPQDQEAFLGPISNFLDFFNNELLALGENIILTPLGSRGIVGVIPSDSCPCVSGVNPSATFLPLCEGTSRSPCACSDEQCQCQDPFVGDGLSCTLDSDGDGYPDSPLQSCTPENTEIFCIQDICPTVNNPNQDLLDCQPDVVITEPEFNGCPYGPDPIWNITWANTERESTDEQRCPGGVDTLGLATRFCDQNGNWSDAVVLECASVQFIRIETQAEVVITSFSEGTIDSRQFTTATAAITLELTVATETETISLLPSDLNTTNNVLSGLLSVLEAGLDDPDASPDTSLVEIFDNVLENTNTEGWLELQTVDAGSQVLLDNAERYGLYLARASNDTSSEMILSRPNIIVSGRMVDSDSLSTLNDSIVFPQEQHLVNHSSDISSAQIIIPVDLVRERLNSEAGTDQSIPVANILFQSLERFLPPSFPGLNNSRGASPVITSQVGSERRTELSSALLLTPVRLSFTFEMIEEALEFQCAFWNFSEPVGNGSFSSTGVRLTRNTSDDSTTTVLCESTHLTSFAVLVDVRGTLQGISAAERLALQVVSYIGCAVSVVCLIITIIYFLLQGKKLFNAVHYFVHLNLAISLCLGYLIFLVGIETATSSAGGCAFVAALLHYFFLAAFCWMLCEGIMLYLMLVVVFSTLTKKWWLFLLIGYCLPLPAVVIGLAARHDYYGVRVDGDLEFCWLSAEKGTIWAFVAPMIVIIIVNVVFLCLVLRSLWKNKKGQKSYQLKEGSENVLKLVKTTFKSVVILLPLLGLTWLFGILTLNANSTVFAWFFLIFNSTQGIFILFFHVIRSDKVWSKIGPRLSQIRSTRFKRYRISRITDSQSTSTSSTFLKGTFQQKHASDSAAVEMGTLRSTTPVTDNTGTLTSDTGPILEQREAPGLEVIENEGVVDPLPEKVSL